MTPPAAGTQVQSVDLQILPWYNALGPREVAVHRAAATALSKGRGTWLIREGQPAEAVFAIGDGLAMIQKVNSAGDRQVLGFLLAGDMFGMAQAGRYTHSVASVTHTHLVRFDRAEFDELCAASRPMQRAVLQKASNELAAAQDHLVLLGRKSASERLATFLAWSADRPPLGDSQGRIWLPMRRSDIANYLGLTLETLSRLFADFVDRGYIVRESVRRVEIRDRDALDALAEGV